MDAPVLQFQPVDLDRHAGLCVRVQEELFAASFGRAEELYGPDGQGAWRYLANLRLRLDADPESAVHLWRAGEVVGQVELGVDRYDARLGYVHVFWLAERVRGSGLFKSLDAYAVRWMRRRGFSAARLSVSPTNLRALRAYERLGWRDDGVHPADARKRLMRRSLE